MTPTFEHDTHPANRAVLAALHALEQGCPADDNSADGLIWAEGCLPLAALRVEVGGVGNLPQPLDQATAQLLHRHSQPAHFGLGEATVLDTKVRDTGMVSADSVTLHWADGARAELEHAVAQGLGLPHLETRLHDVLVYTPGQFFKPHQDTEKHPGMVATLVLVWPSAHIGGALALKHLDLTQRYESQHLNASNLRWFAFYADCQHEVLPVIEGYRVVVTFDLVVPTQVEQPCVAADPKLTQALAALFAEPAELSATDAASHRIRQAHESPWVFLLDHEYTEHGLRWPLLKGADRERVAALVAAARSLGFSTRLALTEIEENWDASGVQDDRAYRYGRRNDSEPEPTELIERTISLNFWVDEHGHSASSQSLFVAEDRLASYAPTDQRFLTNQEYEGYTGNAGETLSYWYRRAALVVESSRSLAMTRFKTQLGDALAATLALARAGDVEQAVQHLTWGVPVMQQARPAATAEHWTVCAQIASALPDSGRALALTLLAPFQWFDLQLEDLPALATLQRCWGEVGIRPVLDSLSANAMARLDLSVTDFFRADTLWAEPRVAPWRQPVAEHLEMLQRATQSESLSDAYLELCSQALKQLDQAREQSSPARRKRLLPACLAAMTELLSAAALDSKAHARYANLLTHVLSTPLVYPELRLAPLWLALPLQARALPEAQALHHVAVSALRAQLAVPLPAPTDHSLPDVPWVCRCPDCELAVAWAARRTADDLVLSLAERRRRHVEQALKETGLAWRFKTLAVGSPHKLVISKPKDTVAQRLAQRQIDQADWAALGQT